MRAAPSPPRHPRRGFSLVEVLVVVGIIALASVLVLGTIGGGFRGMQLRGAAREVAAQLRFTRTLAIATGQVQRFTIDPAGHAWTAPRGRAGTLPPKLAVTFTGARELLPRPGEGAIVFFPDGASSGGRVRLGDARAGWDVDVAWLTGEVRLRRAAGAP